MLENLGFHPGEVVDDLDFARELRSLGDAYVNDAFASSHRAHASFHALPKLFPKSDRAAGLIVEREVEAIDGVMRDLTRPFVVVLGGARLHEKLGALHAMLAPARLEPLGVGWDNTA